MAPSVYAEIKGEKQGKFQAGTTRKGREGMVEITQLDHGVISPRDPASGQPTGKRQHKPLRIWIPVDRSTPLFYNALVHNEKLDPVTFHFWAPAPETGSEQKYMTITLTDASVSEIELSVPDTTARDDLRPFTRISFTYQKIEWAVMDGNVVATDAWGVEFASDA